MKRRPRVLDLQIRGARQQMELRRFLQPQPPIRRKRQAGETLDEGEVKPREVIRRPISPPSHEKPKRKRNTPLPTWWHQVFGAKDYDAVLEKYALWLHMRQRKERRLQELRGNKHAHHQMRDTPIENLSDEDTDDFCSLEEEEEDLSPPTGWTCPMEVYPDSVILSPGWQGPGDAVIRRRNMKDMLRRRREKEEECECGSEDLNQSLNVTIGGSTIPAIRHTSSPKHRNTPCKVCARSIPHAHAAVTSTPAKPRHSLIPYLPVLTPYIYHAIAHTPFNTPPVLKPYISHSHPTPSLPEASKRHHHIQTITPVPPPSSRPSRSSRKRKRLNFSK
ncbi:hypothetical protein E2C01_087336 [Portunus trituberculatus]|uniref:Uncharacterized protein n=1 Tax=Portunus trituberculatus TaxID=210409 RepID=A0A5B7JFW8_PORTR|nr:hypothetical protein [Portunus trituberculatus]